VSGSEREGVPGIARTLLRDALELNPMAVPPRTLDDRLSSPVVAPTSEPDVV